MVTAPISSAQAQGHTSRRLARLLIWATATWCGGAIMLFELAGARLIIPCYGMGVDVWAVVMATSLGALALGYWTGGRLAPRAPIAWLLYACAVMLVLEAHMGAVLVRMTLQFPWNLGLGAAALTLVPPLFLLGAVEPLLAQELIAPPSRPALVVGNLLAAVTLGGVAGSLLTGLLLLPGLGVSHTLLAAGVGTLLLAVACFAADRSWLRGIVALILFAAVWFGATWLGSHTVVKPPEGARILSEKEGLHGRLQLVAADGYLALLADGVPQTLFPLSATGIQPGALISGGDYVELIPYVRPATRDALVIGLGLGLHAHALSLHGIQTRSVEIDPAVVRMVRDHLGFPGEVAVADGRVFLNAGGAQYDSIVIDAFRGSSIPEHLYTVEAFEAASRCLRGDGLLVVHVFGWPEHPGMRALAATLRRVFPHVKAAAPGNTALLQSLYFFASRAAFSLMPPEFHSAVPMRVWDFQHFDATNTRVLTDDRNCLAWLCRDIIAVHHRTAQTARGRLL